MFCMLNPVIMGEMNGAATRFLSYRSLARPSSLDCARMDGFILICLTTNRWCAASAMSEYTPHIYIYIYPQTGTFADPETHPLRAFVPFLPGRVLAFGLFFFAFFVASRASVHTWHGHIPKPNVTRVQSATQWTASVHTLHMPKPNVTRVQSATQWTASVYTLHMPKPNVTRVQSATEWTASVHTLHMPKHVM